MRRSFIPGLIVCGIFLLTNAASQELGKIDATQPTGPLDATRREIDSISLLNLIANLELSKARLERLAETDLAKQEPAVMAKIRRWQGEVAYQIIAVQRDKAMDSHRFGNAYELTKEMIDARNTFVPAELMQQFVDQAELAEAAQRAELWQSANQHRQNNIHIAQAKNPPDADLTTDARLDSELTRRLALAKPAQRDAYWEAKKLSRYRFRERPGETQAQRLSRAAELFEESLDNSSREYGRALMELGKAQAESLANDLARTTLTAAHAILEKSQGAQHRETLKVRQMLDRLEQN